MNPATASPAPGDGVSEWLTDDERDAWMALASLTVKLRAALDAQLAADAGLSFFEYMVMAALSEQPDWTLQMSELADIASASLSRLSHAAKRLEAQGYLKRVRCPGAGRRTNAILTPAGHAKIVATAPGHVAEVRRLLIDPLKAEELSTLGGIARKVLGQIAT